MLVSPRLAHTRAANIHTTHKGGARFARANNSTDGARASRGPIGTVVLPFVCVCGANVAALLCVLS